jgi:hypothetical protein
MFDKPLERSNPAREAENFRSTSLKIAFPPRNAFTILATQHIHFAHCMTGQVFLEPTNLIVFKKPVQNSQELRKLSKDEQALSEFCKTVNLM